MKMKMGTIGMIFRDTYFLKLNKKGRKFSISVKPAMPLKQAKIKPGHPWLELLEEPQARRQAIRNIKASKKPTGNGMKKI